LTLIEPGPTGTGFASAVDLAPALPAYDATPAGALRHAVMSGAFELVGDADRTVAAMIAAGDAAEPTRRVALGSTAYQSIEQALTARLAELRAQRDIAFSADRD
jgi:hypothetical protein